jgi:hypothetical protein
LYRLFRRTYLIKGFLLFSAFLMIILIDALKSAYLESLYEDFESRQPHLVMRFIGHDTHTIESMRELARQVGQLDEAIEAVIPFTDGKGWFSTTGKGFFSSVSYQGEVSMVGVDMLSAGIYPFAAAKWLPHGAYQIPYSLLEAEYELQASSERVLFNNVLFNSHYPPLVSGGAVTFSPKEGEAVASRLMGTFEDYSDKPMLYGTITQVNAILQRDKEHIRGLYLYVHELKSVDAVATELRRFVETSGLKMVVTSWVENESKRRELFLLYDVMSWAIIAMALLLGLILALMLLYRAVIARGRDLVILGYLGYLAARDLILFSAVTAFGAMMMALGLFYMVLPFALQWLDLPLFYPWGSTLLLSALFFGLYVLCMIITVTSSLRVSFSR